MTDDLYWRVKLKLTRNSRMAECGSRDHAREAHPVDRPPRSSAHPLEGGNNNDHWETAGRVSDLDESAEIPKMDGPMTDGSNVRLGSFLDSVDVIRETTSRGGEDVPQSPSGERCSTYGPRTPAGVQWGQRTAHFFSVFG